MALFEWDEAKAESNLRKHGIDCEEAMEVYSDPYSISEKDRMVDGELRWRTIGSADGALVLFVAHTLVEDFELEKIRLISARRATGKERRQYGQHRTKGIG